MEENTLPLLAAEDERASEPEARQAGDQQPDGKPERKARCVDRGETFGRFKAAYPKRDGQQDWPKAQVAFDRFVSAGIDAEEIIRGAELYAADVRRRGVERTKYVKQARSWLNGRLWEEMNEQAAPVGGPSVPPGWPRNLPDPETCFSAWSRGQWPGSWGAPPDLPSTRVPADVVAQWQARRAERVAA